MTRTELTLRSGGIVMLRRVGWMLGVCGLCYLFLGAVARHAVRVGEVEVAFTRQQLRELSRGVDLFTEDVGEPPAQSQGMDALIHRPNDLAAPARWRGPYLRDVRSLPTDPRGNPYDYKVPGPNGAAFEIVSYGSGEPVHGNGGLNIVSSLDGRD